MDNTYSASEGFAVYLKTENCEFSDRNYGMCFYSSFISKGIPLTMGIVPHIANKENFYIMVLFDHLIYNKDRHPGNLLVQALEPIKYFAIDHSHVFKNQAIWDRFAFNQGIEANDFLDKEILELNDDVYSYFFSCMDLNVQLLNNSRRYMSKVLDETFYKNIINELPEQWVQNIDSKDLQALKEYLCYRTEHLEDIEKLIIEERSNRNGTKT